MVIQKRPTPVAVVTGAAMGIGLAVTQKLLNDGFEVIAVDRDDFALKALNQQFRERVSPVHGDVAQWATHERAADAAAARGLLTAWVNNAGVDVVGAAHEVGENDIRRGLEINQLGPMFGSAVAVRRMLPHRSGSIVNVGSIQGAAAFPAYYCYQAAKAAVLMITKGIAADYAPYGIRCNAVLPGGIETPMTYATLPVSMDRQEALTKAGRWVPMGRIGQPKEVAELVAFLLSDSASYITGAAVPVDGGAMTRCDAGRRLHLDVTEPR